MTTGLIKLAQEDPSFHFSRDEETNQTVIEGMGELHLEIIVDRLRREFKVECDVGAPQVSQLLCSAGDCVCACVCVFVCEHVCEGGGEPHQRETLQRIIPQRGRGRSTKGWGLRRWRNRARAAC
jgi:hypothetical protein